MPLCSYTLFFRSLYKKTHWGRHSKKGLNASRTPQYVYDLDTGFYDYTTGGDKLKYLVTITVLLGLFALAPASEAMGQGKKTITELVGAVGKAFAAKTMAAMDTDRPYRGSFKLVIEHSISGRPETRSFRSFAGLEAWLKRREIDGLPMRNNTRLKLCGRGVCNFDTSSLLHNNLYLKQLKYGIRGRRAYIKSIKIVDGD